MSLKVLIIEDEELAATKLEKILRAVEPGVEVAGITDSIEATLDWLNANEQPDIILSDIELSDGQSFEIFRQVNISSMIIFVTSYDEYAMKAFKVNSIDYLLKPVQKEELAEALNKYRQLYKQQQVAVVPGDIRSLVAQLTTAKTQEYRKRFLVKNLQKLVSVEVADIAYFYFDGKLTFFKTFSNQKFILDYTLDELSDMLDPEMFFRISRSFIVAVKSIQRIDDYFGHRLFLVLQPAIDKETIVSRERVNDFKNWLGR